MCIDCFGIIEKNITASQVPNTKLRFEVENSVLGTWHALPSTAEKVEWCGLTLEEMIPGVWVENQWVQHPRT